MPERDQSFPKERRLRKRSDFDRVMQSARGAGDGVLVVFARPLEETAPSRLGLVVGRRIGNAVIRSRAKRRLRSAFRESKPLSRGLEMVIVANSDEVTQMPFSDLRTRLEGLAPASIAKGPKKGPKDGSKKGPRKGPKKVSRKGAKKTGKAGS